MLLVFALFVAEAVEGVEDATDCASAMGRFVVARLPLPATDAAFFAILGAMLRPPPKVAGALDHKWLWGMSQPHDETTLLVASHRPRDRDNEHEHPPARPPTPSNRGPPPGPR